MDPLGTSSRQVPKELFEFPDFPYPADFKCDLFPTGPEVQECLNVVLVSVPEGLGTQIGTQISR